MDNNNLEIVLISQIKKVLVILKERLEKEPGKLILNTLYDRYSKALKIIEEKGDKNRIMINGSVRAYLDSYSDWDNPMLAEMGKAERLLKEIMGED